MKYIFICLSALIIFSSYEVLAQERQSVPFASDLSTPVKHYNKIREDVATSGVVGDGDTKSRSL